VNISKLKNNTIDSIGSLIPRRGGSLNFSYAPESLDFTNWAATANIPNDFIPFSMAIIDSVTREDVVSLIMMINPKDFSVTQPFGVSTANTRFGWVNTLWGNQQATISASGMTAGFYYISGDGSGGLTNFRRKNSLSFMNLMSIVSLFKNNAYYYMDGQDTPTMFKDGTSRVINVMDIIRLSFDGSDYIGNFNSFSLSDLAENPYRMEYNFEFSVSIFGSDPNSIDGHIKQNGNEKNNKVTTAIQGRNTHFDETVGMDEVELKNSFPPESEPPLDDYLRGGGEYTDKRNKSNIGSFTQKDLNQYLKDNPRIDAQLSATAAKMGISKEHLAALIHFESAGTWGTTVNNPNSSALGIGQWIDGSAQRMASTLSKSPYNLISDPSQIKISADLVKYADTVEKQIMLFSAYAESTTVGKGQTLQEAMNNKAAEKDRFETLMVGHFRPGSVNEPRNKKLPPDVIAVNGSIRTSQDYIDSVYVNMNRAMCRRPTIASASAGQK
jgi:hypothetical protein